MASSRAPKREITYPMGAVSQITGLSEHLLRAWESRHHAVEPIRTPGGTRRYRESDVERLRLLASVVDAGHRIGQVAGMSNAQLAARVPKVGKSGDGDRAALEHVVHALERLDATEAERRIAVQLATLGPLGFARSFATPLLRVVGDRWHEGELSVASEHLASAIVRSLLGVALRPAQDALSAGRPAIVFTTLAGDRHELGVLVAALTAQAAGATVVYLGPDLPIDEICDAAEEVDADAVALGASAVPVKEAERHLRAVRKRLPEDVELWIGGARAERLAKPAGVEVVDDMDVLERKVALLGTGRLE